MRTHRTVVVNKTDRKIEFSNFSSRVCETVMNELKATNPTKEYFTKMVWYSIWVPTNHKRKGRKENEKIHI